MSKRRLVAALMAAVTLAAAGCGSSNSNGDTASSTTAKTAATEATSSTVSADTTAMVKATKKLKVAVITPSAENDVAFSQSMYEAVDMVAKERGAEYMEVSKSANLFVVDDAAAAIRDYASKGYDLVIAHGSQYGALLKEIAPEFPEVSFAWGTAADTFGQPNIFAYEAKSDEGGYVLGTLASQLTKTGNIGVIGPVEVGDAKLYVEGFKMGVADGKPEATVNVTYTGSFSDVAKMAEAAKTFATGGADVLTGSSQAVAGAVPVAEQAGAMWFGTQANQTSLSKKAVVASQVYHWEDVVRGMTNSVDAGTLGGTSFALTLENKGLQIEYNPDFKVDAAAMATADAAVQAIISGSTKTTP